MTKLSEERLSEIRMECDEAARSHTLYADEDKLWHLTAVRLAISSALTHERLRAEELVDLLREATSVCKYHACPQCGKTGKEVGMMQVGRPTGTNPLDGKPSAASALRMDVETCTVCQGRAALLSRIEEATKPIEP